MSTRNQQDRVYTAERTVGLGRRFASQAEIQVWVDELTCQEWWTERFPNVTNIECPTVTRRNGDGSVGAWFEDGTGIIEMHPTHWCELYVLHEISHVCADANGSTAHDPLFCSVYLELVYRIMGTDSWLALRTALTDHGVVIDPRDDVYEN